jgi:hypothetical protein
MSKISLAPDDSGSGIFTIASPNSNFNRTLTLPDDTGTIVTDSGNQAGSFTTLNTSGAVVFNDAGADVDFRVESDTVENALFVDGATGNVGIGTGTPASNRRATIKNITFGTTTSALYIEGVYNDANDTTGIDFGSSPGTALASIRQILTNASNGASALALYTSPDGTAATERMRITSGGDIAFGMATPGVSNPGQFFKNDNATERYAGFANGGATALAVMYINRQGSDGDLVEFRQADVAEGSISVSGSTVSYNGGHLSRWAQMLTKPDLLKGTVMSNLDEMNLYIAPTTYWTEEDELPEGVNVGDVKVETHEVENEQLNKVKISDVEGDPNVAGVFVNWDYDEAHQVDEINMAMTGDMIIRIAEGVTVARGDLLMSAGDGTAKPQGDDIVRSKTIAKVTSTHVTCTYEDGSYCVPCVLMAC